MPIAPKHVGCMPLGKPPGEGIFEVWLDIFHRTLDRILATEPDRLAHPDLIPNKYTYAFMGPFSHQTLTQEQLDLVAAPYREAGWAQAQAYNVSARRFSNSVEIVLQMSEEDGLSSLITQIREFVAGRPIRMLTRKANSKADSGVGYTRPLHSTVDEGIMEMFIHVNTDKGVAAANTRMTLEVLKPRPGGASQYVVAPLDFPANIDQ